VFLTLERIEHHDHPVQVRLIGDGDFTACDAAMLNRFFRDYNAAHSRGGTNTKKRSLRHLFTWLEAEDDHPTRTPTTSTDTRWPPTSRQPCLRTSSAISSR
jgi:hypothetical protein